MNLGELEVGDMFRFTKRPKRLYIVRGLPHTYKVTSSATVRVVSRITDHTLLRNRKCDQEVIKVGVSKYKDKYKLKPIHVYDNQ